MGESIATMRTPPMRCHPERSAAESKDLRLLFGMPKAGRNSELSTTHPVLTHNSVETSISGLLAGARRGIWEEGRDYLGKVGVTKIVAVFKPREYDLLLRINNQP